ncbi:exodeoxyribonuclease V subunit gamma [Parachitinimonas caeni]|uniref:RecBCD enzyme subunit RecC n=1 Tax=Parachitinimonas caeni TaxID=3031301 RepID=A0ABT7E0S9_9NEIS|nr:exodeoxyribonuclease V subunit gamma [Parachitinimonas caeni]MDK2125932.1 exodeoxyribonuclease V subunit gamma [Parachitinimonas caeni]
MLHLYQSDRIETLAELLAAVLATPPANPLAQEVVIVQAKGMGRWLTLELARRFGICANVQFPLPATFLWDLSLRALGPLDARSAFSPQVLTWRIFDWLADRPAHELDHRLAEFLQGGDERRRLELAERIADCFDQYLVYRPDWVAAWEKGELQGLGEDEAWQAALWRWLDQASPDRHRVDLLRGLIERLRAAAPIDLPERIVLFGVTNLPPVYLDVLEALASRIDVCIFAQNPCREAWGDIRDPAEITRLAADRDPAALYLEIGNPLLAALGKQGREFFDAIAERFPDTHGIFSDALPTNSLLETLQAEVLALAMPDGHKRTLAASDHSIRIHSCHGLQREIEVLKDELLARLEANPDLPPSQIAVLCPDIEQYTPYIDAVFGRREGEPYIPYAIADRGGLAESPLLAGTLDLLSLPQSRFEVDRIASLLELPALGRKFGIQEQDLPLVRTWLVATGVRWGLTPDSRAQAGLPATAEHTWQQGLDRLLLGYALPQEAAETSLPLFGGVLPYDEVEGGGAQLAGQLAACLRALASWSHSLRQPRPLTEWADHISAGFDKLLAPDNDEEIALKRLRDALLELAAIALQAGCQLPVGIDTVLGWLKPALDEAAGASGFLTGGVTFCTLVPMRTLPYRVIALVGLNDGAFPRESRPQGFDLIARRPRRGDRSRRLDDRYLFLETLLAARDGLHLSYTGRDVRSNTELPPSVLVADLLDVIDGSWQTEAGQPASRQILIEHALQPFDVRYFSNDPRYPGFSPAWLAAARLAGRGTDLPSPLIDSPLPPPAAGPIEFSELLRFFSHPARQLLQTRLGLKLWQSDTLPEPREPFDLDKPTQRTLRQMGFTLWQQQGNEADFERVARAGGLLPHGATGSQLAEQTWMALQQRAPVWHSALAGERLPPVEVDLQLGGYRLVGWLDGLSRAGLVTISLEDLSNLNRVALWLKHLLLNIVRPAGVEPCSRLVCNDIEVKLPPVAEARERLLDWLRAWSEGQQQALHFFPYTCSWIYARNMAALRAEQAQAAVTETDNATTAKKGRGKSSRKAELTPEAALAAARKAWAGDEYQRGDGDNPFCQLAYRNTDPFDQRFETLAIQLLDPYLACAEESQGEPGDAADAD